MGYIRKKEDNSENIEIIRLLDLDSAINRFKKRLEISRFIIDWLYKLSIENSTEEKTNLTIQFSIVASTLYLLDFPVLLLVKSKIKFL